MSERNGDRARFQKDRKRKLLLRERRRALVIKAPTKTAATPLETHNAPANGTRS